MTRFGLRPPARTTPYRLVVIGLLAGVAFMMGCKENLDPRTPEGAMNQLRNALLQRDANALMDGASPKTHELLDALHKALAKQGKAVRETYPKKYREDARAAYPSGVLEAESPDALFAALIRLQLDKIDPSPGLTFGATPLGAPRLDGDRATITTQAGEVIDFVLDGEIWKITVFERTLAQNLRQAKSNRRTLEHNLKVFKELERRRKAKGTRAPD